MLKNSFDQSNGLVESSSVNLTAGLLEWTWYGWEKDVWICKMLNWHLVNRVGSKLHI